MHLVNGKKITIFTQILKKATKCVIPENEEVTAMGESSYMDPGKIAGRIKGWRVPKFREKGALCLVQKMGMSPSTCLVFTN